MGIFTATKNMCNRFIIYYFYCNLSHRVLIWLDSDISLCNFKGRLCRPSIVSRLTVNQNNNNKMYKLINYSFVCFLAFLVNGVLREIELDEFGFLIPFDSAGFLKGIMCNIFAK